MILNSIELLPHEAPQNCIGVPDLIVDATFRGQEIQAMLSLINGKLWFRPLGWDNQWNFLIEFHEAFNRTQNCRENRPCSDDPTTWREMLQRALSERKLGADWDLARRVGDFWFFESGMVWIGNDLAWTWKNETDENFRDLPASFWKTLAQKYEQREDVQFAFKWLQTSPEEKSNLICRTPLELMPFLQAALRLSPELTKALQETGLSRCNYSFRWREGHLQTDNYADADQFDASQMEIEDFLPISTRLLMQKIIDKFPPRDLIPEILEKFPLMRPILSRGSYFSVECDVSHITAHEKMRDALLLREFLGEDFQI